MLGFALANDMSLSDEARAELVQLETINRLRVPKLVDGPQGARIRVDGCDVLDLASNDYLSLANDRRIAQAAHSAIEECGIGAGASRLISGNHRYHVALERALADWLRVSNTRELGCSVRTFSSGYAANVGVLTTLLGPGDVVFSDALNHASIVDGCRLSRAEIMVFPHCDLTALDVLLASRAGKRRLVVSETLFSMDGDVADVAGLAALCKRHDAALCVDEAHAIAVRGPEGRGEAAAAGVVPDLLIGTCGKALGVYGAFVATAPVIADLLWNRARSLVFSTALPPLIAAASARAIEIVRSGEGDDRRRQLRDRAQLLRHRVHGLGGVEDGAIAPLVIGDDRTTMDVSARLWEHGIFAQGIRYPTVPAGAARLRISLHSGLTAADVEQAARSLNDASRHFRGGPHCET